MKIRNWLVLVLVIPAWLFTTHMKAAVTTNNASLGKYPLELDWYDIPPQVGYHFWEDFRNELPNRTGPYDRIGPRTGLAWEEKVSRSGYGIHDSVASTGKGIFMGLGLDSFRETIVNYLPFDEWEERWLPVWLGNFISGTLANTLEEQISFLAASPNESSIVQAQQLFDTTAQKNILRYGVRAWELYFEGEVGHRRDKKPLAFFDVRLQARFGSLREAEQGRVLKFLAETIVPLWDSNQLVLGGSLFPTDMIEGYDTSSGRGPAGAVRFQHIFPGRLQDNNIRGILSVGVSASEKNRSLQFLYSVPWTRLFGKH